jgi:hypothetical protein
MNKMKTNIHKKIRKIEKQIGTDTNTPLKSSEGVLLPPNFQEHNSFKEVAGLEANFV